MAGMMRRKHSGNDNDGGGEQPEERTRRASLRVSLITFGLRNVFIKKGFFSINYCSVGIFTYFRKF